MREHPITSEHGQKLPPAPLTFHPRTFSTIIETSQVNALFSPRYFNNNKTSGTPKKTYLVSWKVSYAERTTAQLYLDQKSLVFISGKNSLLSEMPYILPWKKREVLEGRTVRIMACCCQTAVLCHFISISPSLPLALCLFLSLLLDKNPQESEKSGIGIPKMSRVRGNYSRSGYCSQAGVSHHRLRTRRCYKEKNCQLCKKPSRWWKNEHCGLPIKP